MLTSVLNLVSCVVICSSKSNMYIVNNTEDTLLICCAYYAEFDEIDSVDYFLPAEWDVSLGGDTKLGRDGKLKISNKNLIPPDSAGNYCRTLLSYGPRLGNDNDEKGYFLFSNWKLHKVILGKRFVTKDYMTRWLLVEKC